MSNLPIDINEKRHAVHHFTSSYISFTAIDVMHPICCYLEDNISQISDMDSLFKHHEEALDQILTGALISSHDVFLKMIKIAYNTHRFIKAFNEYCDSIENDFLDYEAKGTLKNPVNTCFKAFNNEVTSLIRLLVSKTQQTGNPLYADFVCIVNVNQAYSFESPYV